MSCTTGLYLYQPLKKNNRVTENIRALGSVIVSSSPDSNFSKENLPSPVHTSQAFWILNLQALAILSEEALPERLFPPSCLDFHLDSVATNQASQTGRRKEAISWYTWRILATKFQPFHFTGKIRKLNISWTNTMMISSSMNYLISSSKWHSSSNIDPHPRKWSLAISLPASETTDC